MTGFRSLAAAGLAAVVLGGACVFSTQGTQDMGHGGGGSSATSTSMQTSSSSTGLGGATSSSTGPGGTGGMTSSSTGMSHCMNGTKDADETDVDCGGAECPRCDLGKACGGDPDCANGKPCQQGVCCGGPCTATCQSCNNADTGQPSGTCTNVMAGKDPGGACGTTYGGVCDDTGHCACSNNAKDGSEAGVDCGGGCTKGCADGTPCAAGTDCASGQCVDDGQGGNLCCHTSCSGSCNSCNFAMSYGGNILSWSGQCVPLPNGVQGGCGNGKTCDAGGNCVSTSKKLDGVGCSNNGECFTNACSGMYNQCRGDNDAVGTPCFNDFWCSVGHICDLTTHVCL